MFNSLNSLANNLYLAGTRFVFLATNLQGVYLIGTYLASPFYNIGSSIIGASIYINNFRNGLQDFYNQVSGQSGGNTLLASLLNWANALINFISNPYPFITNIVRNAFNYVEYMYNNTYAFIFPHVVRLLDTYIPFWRDIGGYVQGFMGGLFYDFNTLRYNPVRWVIERLRAYSSVLSAFLNDPDGWLRERVRVYFPEIYNLVQDPSNYILNKLADGLEMFADRHMTRILKIAERIISLIF